MAAPATRPRRQRLGQGGLVDQAAPGAVDDADAGLHPRQRLRADQVAGLGRERRVQRDVVAPPPEVVERRDGLDPELRRPLGRQEGVEPDHLHVEPLRPPGDGQAHPAQADDPQRLAAELGAGELVAVPAPRLQAVVGLRDVARQGQHQRQGVLGGRDRVAPRRVHHHDPLPGRGRHVDVVDPHPGADDRLQPGLVAQDLGRQLRPRPDHDPVGLGQRGLELRRFELRGDHDLQARLGPEQLQPLLGQRVGHQNAMRHNKAPRLIVVGQR